MSKTGRRRPVIHPHRRKAQHWRPVTWCQPCSRSSFTSRSAAKDHGRQMAPGAMVRAYECPHLPGYFHHEEVAA